MFERSEFARRAIFSEKHKAPMRSIGKRLRQNGFGYFCQNKSTSPTGEKHALPNLIINSESAIQYIDDMHSHAGAWERVAFLTVNHYSGHSREWILHSF